MCLQSSLLNAHTRSMTACNAIIGKNDKRIKLLHRDTHKMSSIKGTFVDEFLLNCIYLIIYICLMPSLYFFTTTSWIIHLQLLLSLFQLTDQVPLLLLKMSLILLTNIPKNNNNFIWSLLHFTQLSIVCIHIDTQCACS